MLLMRNALSLLDRLYRPFPNSPEWPVVEQVPAEAIPPPYHELLVHTHHMTVTIEQFYGLAVRVQVLESRHEGHDYARKILLLAGDKVVQFGLVRIDLTVCPQAIQQEILAQRTPLGRILIQHNMLRRIEPVSYLRVTLSQKMAQWFDVPPFTITYGRIGLIYSGERLAIEVLEILAPIP
jgi:chorismate-pyruvate lyase